MTLHFMRACLTGSMEVIIWQLHSVRDRNQVIAKQLINIIIKGMLYS